MAKYQIELVSDPTDQNELPYPRERFDTKEEAADTAAYRCANHGLPFRVLKVESDGRLTEIQTFTPVK